MRTRSSLTFLIYGSFRGMRSPDWNHFILISSKILFEGVKENTYNSGDTVYSCNITLGGKELEVLNHLKINGLRKEKISTPLVIAILGSTQMLLLSAVNLKQAVASTCEHDKKNLDSPVPAIMKPALLLSLKKNTLPVGPSRCWCTPSSPNS